MRKLVFAIAYLTLFFLIACNRKPNTTSPGTKDPKKSSGNTNNSTKSQTSTPGINENHFANHAAIGGMMEVESSVLILKSTENPDVQTLATIMVKEHTMANKELMSIAKKLNVKLPLVLPKEKTGILNQQKALDEDGSNLYYADLMVKEHEEAVRMFDQANKNEQGELQAFAKKQLPKLKHHLMAAKDVQKILHSIKNDKGNYPLNISKDKDKH